MDDELKNILIDPDVVKAFVFSSSLRIPTTKAGVLSYMDSFKLTTKTPESCELVQNLHKARVDMEKCLNSKTPIWDEIIASVNEYLPLLFTMTWSLTQHQPPLKISKATHFEWRGSFATLDGLVNFVEFAFEIIMTLHTLVSQYVYSFSRLLFLNF